MVLAWAMPGLQGPLILEREALQAGQLWRLWSGHLVHVNGAHLVANLLGAVIVVAWSWRQQLLGAILAFFALAAPVLALLLMATGATWYAGLSGLLHGAFVVLVMHLPVRYAVIGLLAILAKLAWQQWWGGHQVLSDGTPILLASHWLGAMLGLMFGAVLAVNSRSAKTPNTRN